MAGTCDSERRTRLGTVTVTETGVDWQPVEEKPDPYLARMNSERRMVDVEGIRTNGALSIEVSLKHDKYLFTPLPGQGPFTVMFKTNYPSKRLPNAVFAKNTDGKEIGTVPLRQDGDWWVLECSPDVHHYSFSTREAERE